MDLATFVAAIPSELKTLKRFIGWAPDPKSGRPKCPVIMHEKGHRASTRKPETWGTFEVAQHFWRKYGQPQPDGTPSEMGVGFVFADGDGLIYIDLDDAAEAGQLREWAVPFVAPFLNKAYIELSPSGRGLHIVAKGKIPSDACGGKRNFPEHASMWAKSKSRCPEVAIFSTGKYTTLSGDVIDAGRGFGPDVTAEVAQVWAAAGIQATGTDRVAGPPPDPDRLGKVNMQRVPKEVREELKACGAGDAADRSAARFAVYSQMAQKGLEPEEIFAVVLFHDDWYQGSGAAEKGTDHTWQDIVRAVSKTETAKKEFEQAEAASTEEQKRTFVNWQTLGLPCVTRDTKDGPVHEVVRGVQAMVCVLKNHPDWAGRFRFNTFNQNLELDEKPLGSSTSLSPIAESIRKVCGWDMEPNLNLVYTAIQEVAHLNAVSPVKAYLESLQWDGTVRITDWLVRAGCEDEEATRLIGRKWILSLVARALYPGCKVDTVLILEGPQGAKKSTLFSELAGPGLFTDSCSSLDRDGLMTMHGHWIVELAELAAVKKAENELIKRFLATQRDSFRAPYARANEVHPRQFVIVGSTNDQADYLTDPTGARRFWPVRTTDELNPGLVEAERDQLLAEAVAAVVAGEPWWWDVKTQPACITEAQAERTQGDPLEFRVRTWLEANPGITFQLGALQEALGLSLERSDLARRLGVVLRGLGYVRIRRRLPGETRVVKVWRSVDAGLDFDMAEVVDISTACTHGSPCDRLTADQEIDPTS